MKRSIEIISIIEDPSVLPTDCSKILIFSDEWKTRRKQCEAFIAASNGEFLRKVESVECDVRIISSSKARDFIDTNNVLISNKLTEISFGLYCGSELLGVMALGRHGTQIAKNRIILDRMCFLSGVQILGGAAKMLEHAASWAREEGLDEIIGFSDNRWTSGGMFLRLGFELDRNLQPEYFYVTTKLIDGFPAGTRLSKQSQKTDPRRPDSTTEHEWTTSRGLIRVDDAGKKRWIFNLRPGVHETGKEKNSKQAAQQEQKGSIKQPYRYGGRVRGYFPSKKNSITIYFSSSLELRCMFLLEGDPTVASFERCAAFKADNGWRNPDLLVKFVDGRNAIWEVKPFDFLSREEVKNQIKDSIEYATRLGYEFRTWTEKDSGLPGHKIQSWAMEHLVTIGVESQARLDAQKAAREKTVKKHRAKAAADKVEVWCDHCSLTHTARRDTYTRNIKRNGKYICESLGGVISGTASKFRPHLGNPYQAEGKKQCSICEKIKDLSEYNKFKHAKTGVSSACKLCSYEKNVERAREALEQRILTSGEIPDGACKCGETVLFVRGMCKKCYRLEWWASKTVSPDKDTMNAEQSNS